MHLPSSREECVQCKSESLCQWFWPHPLWLLPGCPSRFKVNKDKLTHDMSWNIGSHKIKSSVMGTYYHFRAYKDFKYWMGKKESKWLELLFFFKTLGKISFQNHRLWMLQPMWDRRSEQCPACLSQFLAPLWEKRFGFRNYLRSTIFLPLLLSPDANYELGCYSKLKMLSGENNLSNTGTQ